MPQVSKNWVADISKFYNKNHKSIMDRSDKILEKKEEINVKKADLLMIDSVNMNSTQTISP